MTFIFNSSKSRISAQGCLLAAALSISVSMIAARSAQAAPGTIQPPPPATAVLEEARNDGQINIRSVLMRYGEFIRHDRLGEVWRPTAAPQGWRPYDVCHWVYNKPMKSWYFEDKTEWGDIVQHYGRWTLDQQLGWLWSPGGEFDPGWVAWDMRGDQVGWAPLPAEQDEATIQTAAFKNDPNLWIYVPVNALGKGCGTPVLPVQPFAVTTGLVATEVVTEVVTTPGTAILIADPCWSHTSWCNYWPGHHWNWPRRPNLPPPGLRDPRQPNGPGPVTHMPPSHGNRGPGLAQGPVLLKPIGLRPGHLGVISRGPYRGPHLVMQRPQRVHMSPMRNLAGAHAAPQRMTRVASFGARSHVGGFNMRHR